VLLTLLGPTGPWWPAFVVGLAISGLALWWAWPRAPDLEGAAAGDRGYVIATAVWAFAIVVITAGAVDLGNRVASPIRLGLIGFGLVLIGAYFVWDRRRSGLVASSASAGARNRRGRVGVVIGSPSRAALPAALLHVVVGYGVVLDDRHCAFIVAGGGGPVAGVLITASSRGHWCGGLAAVGAGNVFVGCSWAAISRTPP
jgi:hypothetical protein